MGGLNAVAWMPALALVLAIAATTGDAAARTRAPRLLPDQPIATMDALPEIVARYAPAENGVQICVPQGGSVTDVARGVEMRLKAEGVTGLPSPRRIVQAMRTGFACPFPPFRPELKAAVQADVEGQWVTPVESMRMRFPPRSRAQFASRTQRPRCEAVGYFHDRDVRELQAPSSDAICPFTSLAAFEEVRRTPRGAEWSLLEPGKLVVQPANAAELAEEWDAYVATDAFAFGGVAFRVGDLLLWQRRRSEGALNAAVRFRHLRRLRP